MGCVGTAAVPETTTVAVPEQTTMAAPQETSKTVPQEVMQDAQGESKPTAAIDPVFGTCTKLCVKQEFSVLEMVGLGAKNRYRVCKDHPETEGGKQFLYV